MKNFKLVIVGICTLLFALVVNLSYALSDNSSNENRLYSQVFAADASTTGTAVKIKMCREVRCKDVAEVTASAEGCINVFGYRKCGFGVYANVKWTYFGNKENCTTGGDFYDCDACQKQCVPEDTGTNL